MNRNKIKTWVQDEHFVRPGVNDYPVCRCNDPDDAKWIAGRLNRAAELEDLATKRQTGEILIKDDRPARNNWSPGNYSNTCFDCGKEFISDKYSRQCAPCAYGDSKL